MSEAKVFLVGAGPGDPGLITVKGRDCLQQADVVIYDRLLDPALLELTHSNAEKIYVGKISHKPTISQEEINQLLVKKAQEGKTVVRLKGGDPFIFGRGGEEAEALAKNHVPFEIIPGISSAFAVPAYSGIPITHREVSSSFAVITGHEAEEKRGSNIDWKKISTGTDTLIFLMSVAKLELVTAKLIENGRLPTARAALITKGTSGLQQTILGSLKEIPALARKEKFHPPAVMVIGEVVRFRENLRWFDNKPLFGKRILVTRAQHQMGPLIQKISKAGGIPVAMPIIKVEPLSDFQNCDNTLKNLDKYNWIIFTSVNGVEAFFNRLYQLNLDARSLGQISIAAIGSVTADALEMMGIRADCYPDIHTSRALIEMLKKRGLSGCHVLLPRSDIAGKELPQGLGQLGAKVHELIIYKTVPDSENLSQGKQMLLDGRIDVVTLTSPSAVVNLISALDFNIDVLNKAAIACIGPVTEDAAVKAGLRVDIIPRKSSIRDFVIAIEGHYLRRK